MTTKEIQANEFNVFYSTYINEVDKDLELIEGFEIGGANLIKFFKDIPESKLEYRYAKGKWTIKEVLQHIIDTERVFMHRCFRIARGDKSALTGFEQDDYVEASHGNEKSFQTLLKEYEIGRQSSILLLKGLHAEDLAFIGEASGSNMSSRAAAFATIGHEIHHIGIIKERYL